MCYDGSMSESKASHSDSGRDAAASTERNTRFVMERKGRIEDLDRSFDIEFWQRQGTAEIFTEAWNLVKLYLADRGQDPDELRLQRTVETFQRLPR